MGRASFSSRYGPWAVVAGASEGLGAAFAAALAARGVNLVLLARRADRLEAVAAPLRSRVDVRAAAFDLARADLADALAALIADIEVGLGVFNAAFAPVGEVVDRPVEDLERVAQLNVRGPVVFARTLAPAMVARGRGGIVLMSSLAGLQGAPRIATYAGSKAFNIVFGEGLWAELQPRGVDVLVSCAGAVRTPGYAAAASGDAPGTLDADVVAERTLAALGKGPVVTPGATNGLARFAMTRLLPRRAAIGVMARSTKDLS
ncbi:MAG TPA: SDR family NAD(P)-dependent oxidoreductase [Caulobacteraceae bacterium]|nr:SDR family NAD(P)-dependent oxidoreductase [Caulobacteraceae bacterium]